MAGRRAKPSAAVCEALAGFYASFSSFEKREPSKRADRSSRTVLSADTKIFPTSTDHGRLLGSGRAKCAQDGRGPFNPVCERSENVPAKGSFRARPSSLEKSPSDRF